MDELDYVLNNRRHWNAVAAEFAAAGARAWESEPSWGIWGIPETDVGVFPDLEDRDVLEDGCGTAYVSAWTAGRGARPIGLDNSSAQLATAAALQREHDLTFPLVQGIAERLPFRPDSFDVVISEYGAAIWSDPYIWIPEAARVLRPGGDLIFLGNSYLMMLAVPDYDGIPAEHTLVRSHFGMHRFEWPDSEEIEFHLPHGEWIRLLRSHELEVIDLIELQPPPDATTTYEFVTLEWARRWPSEEIWVARKRR